MKVRRTIPPAAAPLSWSDLWYGLIGSFFQDKAIARFEEEIKTYFGVRYVFPVSSGKAALALILQALRSLSSRREVIIPAYTCYSVPSAVRKAGLKVMLCDIDPKTFDFNHRFLEQAITEETLCVVPSHLFGIPSATDEINRLARQKGAYVIEDAAQAMGGSDRGRKLGTIGDAGFFSLGRGKNITCGSGGLILTNSEPIAEAISAYYATVETPGLVETWKEFLEVAIMVFFIHPALYWFPAGLPFLKLGQTFYHETFPIKKMSGMKAGLLRGWRARLEESNRKRFATGADFRARLPLSNVPTSAAPYLRFPVLVDDREMRDRIFAVSQERGLGVSLMYPTPIHEISQICDAFEHAAFPGATEITDRLLTFPTHPLISEKDKDAIIALFDKTPCNEDRSSADRGKVTVGC
ncbi:MAG: DegT/DnrJ/EryC1/StrS family aminotransferase [Nitrospirae bacterium]|nr:DegT/DnrJ/EryC1/StrS family aminotransferase [Candidatus Manganitrophaceae bacterium]